MKDTSGVLTRAVRVIDFVLYIIAIYYLLIAMYGDKRYVFEAIIICGSVSLLMLFRIVKHILIGDEAAAFNKADMVVISDEVLPVNDILSARYHGIHYMWNEREEIK